MNFAFAPGVTGYDRLARRLFTNRPNTQLIQRRGLNTVAQFFGHLDTTVNIPLPADDLFIASHGNDRAWMQIQLDGSQAGGTDYEAAEAAARSGSVRLPKDVNHNSDGTLALMSVNFRGCRIGAAPRFVDKLKEAFGDQSPVTAPTHIHEIFPLGEIGMMEFLNYSFSVDSRTALRDKDAVVAALKDKSYTFRDGTAVPEASWTKWVPRNVAVGHRNSRRVFVRLGRSLGTRESIRATIRFRHDEPQFSFQIRGLPGLPAKADQLDTLRQKLKLDADNAGSMFAATHPFPLYERYGRSSVDNFVDNLEWSFSWDAKHREMICVARQHEYSVLVPITDPPDVATGKLIYNFYPKAGSPHAAVDELLTSEATMFYTA